MCTFAICVVVVFFSFSTERYGMAWYVCVCVVVIAVRCVSARERNGINIQKEQQSRNESTRYDSTHTCMKKMALMAWRMSRGPPCKTHKY